MPTRRNTPSPALWVGTILGLAAYTVVAQSNQPAGQATGPDFSSEQVQTGQQAYAKNCQSCHGAQLQGGAGPALAGSSFAGKWANGRSLKEFHDFVAQQMPLNAPGSLSADEYLAVTAYVLSKNGFKPTRKALTADGLDVKLSKPQGSSTGGNAGGNSSGQNQGAGSSNQTSGGPKVPDKLPAAPKSVKKPASVVPTDRDLLNAASSHDWLMFNKDYLGQRYSDLKEITAQNAGSLKTQCILQLGETGTFQAGPVVFEGVMYVTTAHNTYALNASNCQRYWKSSYSPQGPEPFNTNRGVALYKGKLFRGTTDGHLLALDKSDGKVLWDAWVADSSKGYFLSSAPIAWNNLVFIGEAGADWGVKAHMYAFNADTGKVAWTFDVIPTGNQMGADSWSKAETTAHGGGSLWTSYTLDPRSGVLYFSVGNPAPDFASDFRPGANLFTDSIVALDAKTGKLRWYAQQIKNDYHDWDTAAAPVVFDADGKRYAAVANKAGKLYIYDRATLEKLHEVPVTTLENADAPLTTEGTRFCPGTTGGVEWNGPAFDPASRTLFVNSVDWCAMVKLGTVRYSAGSVYTGTANGFGTFDPKDKARGWMYAVNPASGEVRWKYHADAPLVAGLTPTAGGVIFTGDMAGNFLTLDAKDGKELYRFNTGGAIGGGVVTYELEGRQYVAVASGNSSRTWQSTGSATVLVFALPSGAK